MRRCWRKAAASLVAIGLMAVAGFAQSSTGDDGKRKIKSKTSPVYPELARRMNVSGKVRIEIIITPDGRVRSTRVVGGHPLLVQACQDSLKDWKYFPAPEESTQIVECEFHGN